MRVLAVADVEDQTRQLKITPSAFCGALRVALPVLRELVKLIPVYQFWLRFGASKLVDLLNAYVANTCSELDS